ncbi:MAG: 16S rRNA (cytidine(1402)-2'-O)-methyltransferase [Proteobacteria bacterium]|nr:16S rRNA (cytidine(1402)-2'-O)-methyltransferase [Pseudomonadota bacterium]MBU1595933.1 16S rRNA (cytidine(1402)-2'-O)-methyltransferase [Pseudomonadota bacterium]
MAPGLFVVATPIGNDADLSPRARDVLSRAHAVLAEDTRRAGLFFRRLQITRASRGFFSLHEHNEAGRIPQVLDMLRQGQAVALISDAGTPVLADPGYRLVRACREAGLCVTPLPGPSAPAAALSACGLPPAPYTFFGFLPRQKGQAKRLLARHAGSGATLVFFERKDRLPGTLALAAEVLGDREVALCRELTKVYEEFILGRLGRLQDLDLDLLGEITVVIGPEPLDGPAAEAGADQDALVDAAIAEERARGGKPREVARRVAERVPGRSVKEIYERLGRNS